MGNVIDPELIVTNNSIVSITQSLEVARPTILDPAMRVEKQAEELRDIVKREWGVVQSEARSILERATKLEVTTDSGMLDANQFIVDLAPAIKKATQYKDALTKETKGVLKDVDAVCKSVIDALEGANDTVRRKVIQYRREQEEAQKEVTRILTQDKEWSDTPPIISPPTPAESKTIRVDGGQISYSKKWTFTITDIDKVPEEIIRAAVKTSRGRDALESIIRQRVEGGIRKIEGVVIEETEQSTVRK